MSERPEWLSLSRTPVADSLAKPEDAAGLPLEGASGRDPPSRRLEGVNTNEDSTIVGCIDCSHDASEVSRVTSAESDRGTAAAETATSPNTPGLGTIDASAVTVVPTDCMSPAATPAQASEAAIPKVTLEKKFQIEGKPA
jgi:hypothetical protein